MAAVGVLVTPTAETGLCGRPWNHLAFLQNEILYVFLTSAIHRHRYL